MTRKLGIVSALAALGLVLGSLPLTTSATTTMMSSPKMVNKHKTVKAKVGLSKIVAEGIVVGTNASSRSLTVHVLAASKNAKAFLNLDKTFSLDPATKITKNGKALMISDLKSGDRVRLTGILDKNHPETGKIRWVKVLPPKPKATKKAK